MRRLIRAISSVLILSGLLLVLDAAATLVWQEPVTAAIGVIMRNQVNQRYLSYKTAPLTGPDAQVLHAIKPLSQRIAFLARRERAQVKTGDAVGQIQIPRIGNTYNIVQGTDTQSLEEGPGHYPQTALPGMGQTVAIAGHRTTYLAPFRFLNELKRGDRVVVRMPYGRFTYVVQQQRIVKPTEVSVIDDVGYDRLVLSACNPLYSAAQRIIIFARLKAVQPLGPARAAMP
ncbi:MAG: sortase [Solirubrobacteraceae bacterium]